MSFTIATKDTRIFRTKITNVRAEFDHFEGDNLFFEFNFDNFRTYTSGGGEVDARCPKWSLEMTFNYETEFADLLAAKIMKIGFFKPGEGDSGFVGDATCDLLTLATGCQDCRFSIYQTSDRIIGKVFMNIEMEEVAETCVIVKELKISFQQGRPMPQDMSAAMVYVETKALEPGVRCAGTPTHHDAYNAMWRSEMAPNYFGSTVTSILQESGLRIRIVEAGYCTEVDYGYGLLSIGSLPEEQLRTNPRGVMFDHVPLYEPSGKDVVGAISGVLAITHMPKFAQMYAGQNIDGVVHEGQSIPGAKNLPPRMVGYKGKLVTGA